MGLISCDPRKNPEMIPKTRIGLLSWQVSSISEDRGRVLVLHVGSGDQGSLPTDTCFEDSNFN